MSLCPWTQVNTVQEQLLKEAPRRMIAAKMSNDPNGWRRLQTGGIKAICK